MSFRLSVALVAATLVLPLGAAAETIRCSHQFPPQHHITGLIERWAAEVERLSRGRIEIELVGEARLYKPEDNILAVAKGDVECAFSLNFQWARKLPLMYATLAPFMTRSQEIPRRWWGSEAAQLLEERMHEKGVQSVAWLFQSNQTVITSDGQHVLRPEDFAGKRTRGLIAALDQTLQRLGAVIVPMNASELYESTQNGAVDVVITDVAVAVARRLYEQHDHMVLMPLMSVYVSAYVTPQWYDLLGPELQDAFRQAGENAMRWSVNASMAAANAAPAVLRERGVDVHIASAEEIEVLRAALQPAFLEMFLEESGEDGRKLLDLIAKLQ